MQERIPRTFEEAREAHVGYWTRKIRYFTVVETVAPQYGFDANKYRLGGVVNDILNDDGNCFVPPNPRYTVQERSIISRDAYMLYLNWEIATPGMPANILDPLSELYEKLQIAPWNTGGK